MTTEASMRSAGKAFVDTLNQRCGFEAVNVSETAAQLRAFGRVPLNRLQMDSWLLVVQGLLVSAQRAAENGWALDVSKQYFVSDSGQLLFGWRLIVQLTEEPPEGVELGGVLGALSREVVALPQPIAKPGGQLMEVPLHANPNRHSGAGGRGSARPVAAG